MVAGHLQTKKGYYYMVLNLKSEDGNRKSKWISTGIPATGKKSAKLAEEMLAETRCTYKDAASPCAVSPVISREDISFSDYMIKWLGIIKNSVSAKKGIEDGIPCVISDSGSDVAKSYNEITNRILEEVENG